jgi:hypothetical protein
MTDRSDPVVRRFTPKPSDAVSLEDLLKSQAPAPATPEPVKAQEPGVVPEIGGRKDGLDPTRYGDWEKNGRCIDF